MMLVGSARIDENGRISGGKAGDQTGKEICTQEYYPHAKGWYCLRIKSVDAAEGMAEAMLQACNNENLGYDQGQRNTGIEQLKKVGNLGKISTKCEFDCSSLVRACIMQATGKDVGDIYTGNLADVMERSGLFENRFTVNGPDQLFNGDVLVTKTKGHTVIVVSGRNRKSISEKKKSDAVYGWQKAAQADGYRFPKYGADGEWGSECEGVAKVAVCKYTKPYKNKNLTKIIQTVVGVEADGLFGKVTEAAVKAYQKAHGLVADGVVGLKTWKCILGV